MRKLRKFNPSRGRFLTPVIIVVAFGLVGGIAAVLISRAATAITIDGTLPVPQNVRAYGDDRNIIVTWDPLRNGQDNRVVGYYVTYRPKGSNEPYKVRQQQVDRDWTYNVDYQTAVQLQPLQNGVEYEINVQSVSGTRRTYPNGNLVEFSSTFYVADGKASNKATTFSTPSSARVDDMRNRLTGFFDDFNQPAGPFDELKWNTATTACIVPNTAAAFLNDQFHSHNQIKSSCDRAGIVSRPRGIFDITGATEQNPAIIQFDVDGASQPRDTWYLDLIPLSARPQTRLPLDVTSHNDLFDDDSEDPGNMVRINARADTIDYAYYAPNRSPRNLSDASDAGMPAVSARSPLPAPDIPTLPIPNVRNHWIVEITPTKMRVIINGERVAVKSLPAEFAAEKKFTIHSTMFSYNTGKQYNQVTPYVQLLHWDNFGFSGPAQTEVIHNYLEGGPTGSTPVFSTTMGNGSISEGNRTTVIPIPDQIGTLKNGKARLYFTMQDLSALTFDDYQWNANHNVVVNGTTYPFPNPRLNMNNPKPYDPWNNIVQGYIPLAMTLDINQSDIRQGNNTVRFNLGSSVLNVHLELPYDASNQNIPSYTQPLQVFGQAYAASVRPAITTCDQYWFVERDLGLTYGSTQGNLITNTGCQLIDGHTQTQTAPDQPPVQPPANQTPSITLSSSTTSTTSPATFTLTATASDIDGSITKIDIRQGNTVVRTCISSPCTFNAANISAGSYVYSAVATDNGNATATSANVTVTVSEPTPPPTASRFNTLGVNAALPSDSECAARVRPAAEVRPANQTANNTRGVGGNYTGEHARVTGNFSGTTDEIIQWAACKHGLDEDVLRAQMVQESFWHQSAIGDFTSGGASLCSTVYPPGNYPPQFNGDAAHNGQCPESYGLSQVRWTYHKSAFYRATAETTANLTNNAIYSTAYNVDYWGSVWRNCYNGTYTWLNTVERGRDYSAGDQWGCLGMWFSGRWYTQAANDYIAGVQGHLNAKTWTTTAFRSAQPVNTIPGQTSNADTTPPQVSITAPTNNATVSGTVTISASASDNVGVTRVSYFLDGSSTAFSNDSTAPYSSNWNSATVANGTHTIRATALDAAGNVGSSTTITVNVQNTVPDTTAPTASVTTPANNTTVSGTITLTASASDNVGVSKVELLIDGQVAATDTTSPYSFSVYTPSLSEGNHTFSVRAFDASSNNTLSSVINLTIDNVPTPPAVCEDTKANNVGQPLPCTYTTPPPAPKPGDANGDGKVDIFDLSRALSNWGRTGATRSQGDMNGDGVVNIFDLSILLSNWQR